MSVFLPAKQLKAETLDVRSKQRTDLSCKLAIAMDTAKKMERMEVYFFELDGISTTVIESVTQELRELGYAVDYSSGQREGRSLRIMWGNA